MSRKYTLYWSSLSMYEACPQKYLWSRGWGDIDLGRGPGKSKERPLKSSAHHAMMGTVIQAVIERMYNDELWKHPGLVKRLEELIDQQFRLEMGKTYIDWRLSPPMDELLATVTEGVMGFLKTFKHNKLIGPYARCEEDYLAYIDKYNPVGGRFDFLIRRDDVGVMILDGKNGKRYFDKKSKTYSSYIDPDQLRFYAMTFFLAKGVLPAKLGFIPFRYPWGYIPPQEEWPGYLSPEEEISQGKKSAPVQPEPETGVKWVDFTKDDLKGLAQRAVDARTGMEKERFEAKPEPPKCKFCDYETVCPARIAQKEANSSKRGPKTTAPSVLEGATGFVQFGFGGGVGSPSKE